MAQKFWVGGTGNWSDATNHWALSSGGAPGVFNTPGSTDDVHFDAASFTAPGQQVNLDMIGSCKTMNWTGATNTPTFTGGQPLYVFGDLTLIAGMNMALYGWVIFYETSGTATITSAGQALPKVGTNTVSAQTLALADALLCDQLQLYGGTFVSNSKAISCNQFNIGWNASTVVVYMSGATVTCGKFSTSASNNITFHGTSSTFNVSGDLQPYYGLTFGTVNLTGTLPCSITGNNTFATLATNAYPKTLTFATGSTQTITTAFNVNGNPLNKIVLTNGAPAGVFTLTKTSGTITVTYCNIYNSTATGGASWNADVNSLDGGGNTGWIFAGAPPVPGQAIDVMMFGTEI